MAVKRKRSITRISPISDSTTSSYSERDSSQSPTPCSTHQSHYHSINGSTQPLHQIDNWSMKITPMADPTPSHLHSRTRKRFRDNRPDENIIHENTYQKLFSAQRPSPQPMPSNPRSASDSSNTSQKRTTSQSSLHNFWTLPHPLSLSRLPESSLGLLPLQQQQILCQDCDAYLGALTDDGSMDVDMGGMGSMGLEESEYNCRQCRRLVCDMCAIVSPGEGRECLQCKTSRNKWVGGIGWMQPEFV